MKGSREERPSETHSGKRVLESSYQPTEWERLDAESQPQDFVALEVDVLDRQRQSSEPMFGEFSENPLVDSSIGAHGAGYENSSSCDKKGASAFDISLFERELKKKYEEGHHAGCEEGIVQGREEVEVQLRAVEAKVGEFIGGVLQQHQELVAEIEKKALDFSLLVARKILSTTVEVKPEYIFDVVKAGINDLGASQLLRIRVSPEDYEFLQVIGIPPELSQGELGVEYVADETIQSGCVIETDFGEVDMQLEKMWERVRSQLEEAGK